MKDLWGLGLNCYSHDASASLLKNGEVIFTAEEERFNREKHSEKFPNLSIKAALEFAEIKSQDLQYCAYFFRPSHEIIQNAGHFVKYFPETLNLFRSGGGSSHSFFSRLNLQLNLPGVMKELYGIDKSKFYFVEHHLAHAASAFYPSPYEDSAILTWDGRGEATTILYAEGVGNKIKKIYENKVPHSLGHLYSAITSHLGFRPFCDEWKVMGMSAYGTDQFLKQFEELVNVNENGELNLNLNYFNFHTHGAHRWVSEKFKNTFGLAKLPSEEFTQRHYDLAFALQRVTESAGLKIARFVERQTRSKNLCMTGGVSLNVLLNKVIIEQTSFENYFIQPIASDAGTSFGAALFHYHDKLNRTDRSRFVTPYLGQSFTDQNIESELINSGLKYFRPDNIVQFTAQEIVDNKIVGWFQGRQEAGPRALGNRSILANPQSHLMKDKLNTRVKRREHFRPFAPSVTEEDCHEIFKMPRDQLSPYMILAGEVREKYKSKLPAITHHDGTARVHTVSRETNRLYWEVIREVGKLSGIPVVLNTSFNENEPIVNTPKQAIDCFLRTEFDVLVLGSFAVRK